MDDRSSNIVSGDIDTVEIMRRLGMMLPALAVDLIKDNLDMSDAANRSFVAAPDDPMEHTPRWHQHGIITHSIKFCQDLQVLVPEYLNTWGVGEEVDAALATEVDGISKERLLRIVALVHDLGKFTARKIKRDESGAVSATFAYHEEHSGRIVRDKLRPELEAWGLTDRQIAYTARCAELHFELGKARLASKATSGYNIEFTKSAAFATAADKIMAEHPEYAVEIGVQFIADSSSKTEVAATADNDAGIEAQRPELEREIAAKGLHPALINQALQQPVNLELAKGFLELWARGSTSRV